jgi:ribosomal-protein-alanine N-acetyltransferase
VLCAGDRRPASLLMPLPLRTARLTIRPLAADDAGDVFSVYGDPLVLRFWNSDPLEDVAGAAAWAAAQGGLHQSRGFAQWHVRETAGGRFVGCLGLQPLEAEVEILYALVPGAWGCGYATEAGLAALEYGLAEAGLERVVGIAREANEASVRVLRKLGMRALGRAEYWGGEWAKYELTAEAWRAEREAATPPLHCGRLDLRRLSGADHEALAGVFGDPEVMRFVGAGRRPLDDAAVAAALVRAEEHWDERGFGPLAVVERASGRLVGEAGLQLLEGGPDVELTYTFARAAWGRGYATEAARAVLLWGFAGLRLPRIVAVAHPSHAASLRVMHKLGMTPQGGRECYGARLDEGALTLGEWRAATA